MFLRFTLYCRMTLTPSTVGQETGKVFSIPNPPATRRTVYVFSP